jgi:hypothetical protein
VIIVEGPDGSGKSTLCKYLGEEFDLQVVAPQEKGRMPKLPVRNRVYRALGKAVQGRHPAKIYDRLYFSELVYGPAIRGRIDFSPGERTYIENILWSMHCPIILCLPPLQIVRENLTKDSDSMEWLSRGKMEDPIQEIYNEYCKIPHRPTGQLIEYDYTSDNDLHRVVNTILKYLRDRKWREYGN